MKFISVCSGIEAASVAFNPLGFKAVAFSEIEPFPCAVLAHHYPNTPNWGDMTKFKDWPDESIDLLCGGTPCQSFSVAGLRKGLDDPRGNLMLTFGAIAAKYRPQWLVWENVPGVLSSNGGADFGSFLGMLGELGYGFAYRVLDAQYFGVAQRRRRVFVVACLGDWRSAAAVLFERHSMSGHPAPSREVGKVAPTIPSRSTAGGGLGTDFDLDGGVIHAPSISPALKARDHKGPSSDGDGDGAPLIAHSLRAEGFDASEDGTGRGTPLVPCVAPTLDQRAGRSGANSFATSGGLVPVSVALRGREGGATIEMGDDLAFALRASSGGGDKPHVLAFDTTQVTSAANRSNPKPGDPCHPLAAGAHAPAVAFMASDYKEGTFEHCETARPLTTSADRSRAAPLAIALTGEEHASPQEADAIEALRVLRREAGEEAFAVWRSGILDSFQPSEVLRQGVHGQGLRRETLKAGRGMDDGALPREASDTTGSVHDLRQAGRERRAPQGRGLPEQFARQLDSALSQLPHEGAQPGWLLQGLRGEGEGAGVLQPALHPAQGGAALQVRRLTSEECEKLQGFLPGYTAIPWRGKAADKCPDGPRYKALGNSWAVPNVRWIGERLQQVEVIRQQQRAAA